MNFTSTKEDDEMNRKLDRILGTCSNIRDNIEIALKKNNTERDKSLLYEDINLIAGNLNSVMKSTEAFFRYYLVVPNTTVRDDSII
jgi:hypothetical protein